MSETLPKIAYPELPLGSGHAVVESLSLQQACSLAPAIVEGLIVPAYSARFEAPNSRLPQGSFAATYGNDKAVQRFQDQTIPSVFERGGGYNAIRDLNDASGLISVLKTLPGDQVGRRFKGMIGIAEILTHPAYQRRGYGAATLHAYLKYQGLPQGAGAMLDAFDENEQARANRSVNDWYTDLGFKVERPSGELNLAGGHALTTHYYVTKRGLTIANIVQRLEARHPVLLSAIVSRWNNCVSPWQHGQN